MKKIIAVAGLLVAAAATGFLIRQSMQPDIPQTPPATTDAAPATLADTRIEFEMPDLEGNLHKLSEWDGEARLVNFWATWCKPCRKEIPLLKQLQSEKAEKGLQVIGIAVEYPEDVLPFAAEAQFNYPILVGQQEAMEAAEQSGIDFIGLPFTLIISPEGDLVNVHAGEIKSTHIDRIVDVMRELQSGAKNLEQAREALHML